MQKQIETLKAMIELMPEIQVVESKISYSPVLIIPARIYKLMNLKNGQ